MTEDNAMPDTENRYRIDAVYRACTLLKEIARSDDPMNLPEASAALDATENGTFRTLKTLEECGFVRCVAGGYELGDALPLCWKAYRTSQKVTIERAKTALKNTAITGEDDDA
jgi:DNA-binding IclR family transcriptional regulator